MSKLVKSIIGKCVVSILFITMPLSNFTYNVNNIVYAEEVQEVDKQTLAKENLVMLDIYNSSVFDTSADFLQYVETYGMDLAFGTISAILGQPEGVVFALGNAMTHDIPFRKIDISDLSKKITDKTLEIFGNKVIYIQEEKEINKGDTFDFVLPSGKNFCSSLTSNDPIYSQNLENINSVYSGIVWTFQADEYAFLDTFNDKYSVEKKDIITISPYVSSMKWSSGSRGGKVCLQYHINGEYKGIVCYYEFSQGWGEMENPYIFTKVIPFSATCISNLAKLNENIPNSTNLEKNNSTDKMYNIGDNALRFINSVDENGQVNGIDVLNENNQLTNEIVKYFLENSDSTFVDSSTVDDDYSISLTNTTNTDIDNNNPSDTDDDNKDLENSGNDGFISWLWSGLKSIVNFFKYCYNALKEIFVSIVGITDYVSLIFNILPEPLPSLMKMAIVIMLLVSVIKFIKG